MIFVGDIALPLRDGIILKYPDFLDNKYWLGNLEGGVIVNQVKKHYNTHGVFNDIHAIEELTERFNFTGFALANNHISDLSDLNVTKDHLNRLSIPFCGVGISKEEASTPLVILDDDTKVVILNFGWEVIQCEVASNNKAGVNPMTKDHILESVRTTVNKYPDAKIITYMHWNYELEAEPQPFERELAKKMIDLGVAGVIGSHPHRVGGFELYKDKPIVYSLGNWMFKQNYYFDGKLSFPDFCNLELAFEWDLVNDDYKFHFFNYEREKSELTYLPTEGKDSPTMKELTPFLGLSDKEYRKWYKSNHYHRNKGLPIYYWDDSAFTVKMKNRWNKTKDWLISIIVKIR